ncbi:hypothetical protein PTTG_06014 [Puccinia triticina 1-1 BBBD Race 1]|uniref:Myb_DNA-bind_3 domain-containing protein n=1 Tax=Puccinia triticina (isolate 1-1 / race 1 (BBBD)) TaxID=630390 RepID=A0A0C4EYV9_PUCT1|nr:hypothetical protein PTTG_06014 [Puccinia triticina 1-1 BBBD Race 1]WAR52198.1 hypothetical protein PtB15_1B637 [Puccinia triticina]
MAQIEDAGPELIQSMKPETPVHMMRPMDSPGPPTIKPICRWTEQDDLTLIAVLKAELQRNPTPANGFRGSTWPTAAQALAGSEVKTGSKAKDPTGCRSRYSSLKRSYLELKHLRSMAEARWDEHVKRVILPEEIWASFLANSSEKGKSLYRWRQKRFPLYNQVSDLIDGHLPVADGPKQAGDAVRSASRGSSTDQESPPNDSYDPLLWQAERPEIEEEEEEDEIQEHPQLARPILSAPPSAKRRRITHEDMFLKHLKEIGDNLKSRPSLRVEAIRLLQLDGQLSEPELLKAIDYLGPLEHAETYIALEPRLRTTWIRTKLGDVRPL